MAKKIKFALKMRDGVEVRTLQELKDGFNLNAVMAYFLDGKLESWLSDRYYDDLADSIQELDKNDPELRKKLCGIFGVEYEDNAMSIEEIEERNRRINRLKEITDDESIIENVDGVAFSQEELADLLDEGKETIYLCGTDFKIPVRKKNITYIGVNTTLTLSREECEKYAQNNIEFINLLSDWNDRSKGIAQKMVNEINFNQALFVCNGSGDNENFIACTMPELEEYEMYEREDDEIDDNNESAVDAEFYSGLIKIKNPEISHYLDAVYDGTKIIYMAEDGQGTLLATMGTDGENVNIIRRWDENEGEELKNYFLGREHVFVAYTKDNGESEYEYLTERISADGEVTRVDDGIFLNDWENYIEMKTGLYSISFKYDWENEDGGWLNVKYLLHTEKKIKNHKFKIKNVEEGSDISSWNIYNKEIFFFLYDYESDDNGRFYCFNTETSKVKLASKIYIDYEIGAFCVNQDGIYFYRCEDDDDSRLDFLGLKTGKVVPLWYDIDSLKEIKIIGEYVYLLPGYYKKEHFLSALIHMWGSGTKKFCYRMKLDGTEKTLIGNIDRRYGVDEFILTHDWNKDTKTKEILLRDKSFSIFVKKYLRNELKDTERIYLELKSIEKFC